jgi:hypothetical protein
MKNKLGFAFVLCLSLFSIHCTSKQVTEQRSPSAIPQLAGMPEKVKITDYLSEPKVIEGYLVTMHFIKNDQELWYFTFGCSKNSEAKHSFEVYFKPYLNPTDLEQSINTSYLKDSQTFESKEDCDNAFAKIAKANSTKPVCLINESSGFLVSECPQSFPRRYREMRERM